MNFVNTNTFPPRRVEPGTLYRHNASGRCYLALPDGTLLNLCDLLDYLYKFVTVPQPGPRGEQGPPGQNGKDGKDGRNGLNGLDGRAGSKGEPGGRGEKGERGVAGRDGKNGSAGKDGKDGAQGPCGAKGERGDVLYVGAPEIQEAAKRLQKERATMHAKLQQAINDAASLPKPHRTLVQQPLKNVQRSLS